MRIVHLAPPLTAAAPALAPAVQGLAQAQAQVCGGHVQVVVAGAEPRQTRVGDLEVRTLPLGQPGWLGRSRAVRRHLLHFPCEILHVHSLGARTLHYAHLAAQRHGAPLVLSPQGKLGLGETERLHLRCALQRLLVHPQALEQAAGWHATCAEEASAIRAGGFRQPVCVAPPGVAIPTAAQLAAARAWWHARFPALAAGPVALCLAPSAPAARLRHLLELWTTTVAPDWRLLLVAATAGGGARLAAHAARLGLGDRAIVAATGEYPPHAVATLFLDIGTAATERDTIAAALAAGLPALVVDELPWRRLVAEHAGWSAPWPAFGPALTRSLATPAEELAALGRNARTLATNELNWTRTAELLLAFYRNLRR